MSTHKKKLLFGTIWSLLGQFGTMGLNLFSNILIARVLTPFEFGQVGIIMFFVVLATVFTDGGLSGALVRKKEVTKEDYSTVFVFNFVVSIVCYIILVILAGFISSFYNDSLIKELLWGAGCILIINSFSVKQNVELTREMNFMFISLVRFIATFVGCFVGVFFAYNGFGVWSLVYMQIVIAIVNTLLIIINKGLFVSFKVDKKAFQNLYGFGLYTTLAQLLNIAFDNIYQLIIGKVFTLNQAGLFYQAKKLQEVPSNVINSTIQGVCFSFLSKYQHEKKQFIIVYNKILVLFTIVMGAITALIFIYSKQIIHLLYGDKWLASAYMMQLLCVTSFFYLQEMLNRVIFKVFDKTKQIFLLEIFKKIIQSISIIFGIYMKDISVLLFGFVIISIISYGINFYYSRKVLENVVFKELVVLGKVIFTALIIVGVYYFMIINLNIVGNTTFFIAPILLFLFFKIVKILGISNIMDEFRAIQKMIQNR